jgi:hypothetical protein
LGASRGCSGGVLLPPNSPLQSPPGTENPDRTGPHEPPEASMRIMVSTGSPVRIRPSALPKGPPPGQITVRWPAQHPRMAFPPGLQPHAGGLASRSATSCRVRSTHPDRAGVADHDELIKRLAAALAVSDARRSGDPQTRGGRTSGSSRRSAGFVRLAKVLNKLEKAHVGTRDRSKFAHQVVSLRRICEFLALLDRSHAHHHHHRVAIGAFVKLGRHETWAADDHVSHSVGDPSGQLTLLRRIDRPDVDQDRGFHWAH